MCSWLDLIIIPTIVKWIILVTVIFYLLVYFHRINVNITCLSFISLCHKEIIHQTINWLHGSCFESKLGPFCVDFASSLCARRGCSRCVCQGPQVYLLSAETDVCTSPPGINACALKLYSPWLCPHHINIESCPENAYQLVFTALIKMSSGILDEMGFASWKRLCKVCFGFLILSEILINNQTKKNVWLSCINFTRK